MQPGTTVVPSHAQAVFGEGAPADAVARLEHEHRDALAINSFAAVSPAPPAPITRTSGVADAARSGAPNVPSSAPAPMPCRSSLRFIKGLLSATP